MGGFFISPFLFLDISIWEKKKQPYRTLHHSVQWQWPLLAFFEYEGTRPCNPSRRDPSTLDKTGGVFYSFLRRTVTLAALLDRANEL